MAIDKINLKLSRSLQSVYEGESKTALEMVGILSKKVDECIDEVNGVEQSAIEARAIVDVMKQQQDDFIRDNNDTRQQLIADNKNYLDELAQNVENIKASYDTELANYKTNLENDYNNFVHSLNEEKESFSSDMENAVNNIIDNANTAINNAVNQKIDRLISDGTIESLINDVIIGDAKQAITSLELNFSDITGYGVVHGLNVVAQSIPNMSVIVAAGVAHLYNGKRYELEENITVNIDAADALYNRIDIIYINSDGQLTYGKGVATQDPIAPIPVNGIVIAEIFIAKSTTSIKTNDITDKRTFKPTLENIVNRINNADIKISENEGNIAANTSAITNLSNKISGLIINSDDFPRLDNETDDSGRLNRMIDYAYQIRGTILLQPGHYTAVGLKLKPGITIIGYGATIQQPAGLQNYNPLFHSSDPIYSSEVDSDVITIKGLTLDGNRKNQGDYTNYQLQHNYLLHLCADKNKKGRLRVNIEDVTFQESTSDGIQVWHNVDLMVNNCRAINCFRGGLVVTGGYSKVHVNNFYCGGDVHETGIDFEIDTAGYGNTKQVFATLTNIELDGDFDVQVSEGSILYFNNVICHGPDYFINAEDSTMKFVNCKLVGKANTGASIYFPHNVTFENCEFVAYKDSSITDTITGRACQIYTRTSWQTPQNQRLIFNNCIFRIEGKGDNDTFYTITTPFTDSHINNNKIIFNNCKVETGFKSFINPGAGGNFEINNLDCDATSIINWVSSGSYSYNIRLTLIGRITGNFTNLIWLATSPSLSVNDIIEQYGVVIDSTKNKYGASPGCSFGNQFQILGNKVIYGDTPPNNVPALKGDIYRLKTPINNDTYEWIAITSHHNSATWEPLTIIGNPNPPEPTES